MGIWSMQAQTAGLHQGEKASHRDGPSREVALLAGLLALREPVDGAEEEVLLGMESQQRQRWNLKHPLGWALLFLGLLQCVTGIVSQILSK